MLEPIEKGQPGWKKRRLQITILEVVSRSTTPQTGWDIYQKLRKKKNYSVDGNDLCIKMNSLCEMGYLKRVGHYDCDSQYIISKTE